MPQGSRAIPKLTYDDLLAMFPEGDGLRHELINGEHFVTPSPAKRHQQLVRRLTLSLGNHLEAHPDQGELFTAPFDVVMSPCDVVEPDLLVVLGDQQGILNDKNVSGAPALVIEILSPGTRQRDQGLKRTLYDRQGVREYWMVDPDHDWVTICRRSLDGSFPVVVALGQSAEAQPQMLQTPLLPGWTLALEQLFR
jgi:Uma2 family endonuclease